MQSTSKIVKFENNGKVEAKLNATEKSLLVKYETIIDKGLKTVVTVGKALEQIRDAKLYRETHRTFESYVFERFDLVRQRAYQIIDASVVISSLPNDRQGEVNEAKAAELKDVPAGKRVALLDKANKAAKADGKATATAKHVKAAKGKNGSAKKVTQDRKSPTNSKAADSQDYSLQRFRKEVGEMIADYKKHKLPVSAIIVELEGMVSILKTEKLKS